MKKFTVILITLLYSISTLGIGLKEFYCCGKLKSVTITLVHEADEKCDKGGKKSGCCKTEHQFLKIKDSHLAPGDVFTPIKFIPELNLFITVNELKSIYSTRIDLSNDIHGPPVFDRPIYLFNCVYRI